MDKTPEPRLFREAAPDDWHAYRRYQYLLAKLLFYTVISVLTYLALSKASGVLSMVFLALLIAYVLDPVVDWFENKGLGRSSAIALLLVFVVSFTTLFSVWMVPTLVYEFAKVGDKVREIVGRDPSALAASLESSIGLQLGEEAVADLSTKAKEYAPKALEHIGAFVAQAASRTMGVIGWLVHLLVLLSLIHI